MPTREYQQASHRPALRRAADGKDKIGGYGSVFFDPNDPGSEFELCCWGSYRCFERIMEGAFDRALREQQDVRLLVNHDASQVLGRTRSGTLRLSVDKKGLKYECDPPDTQIARDLIASMRRGDVSGSSFCFDILDHREREIKLPDGSTKEIIEILDVNLLDCSVVTFPCYQSATSTVRNRGIRMDQTRKRAMSSVARSIEREVARLCPTPARPRTRGPLPSDPRRRAAVMRARLVELDI